MTVAGGVPLRDAAEPIGVVPGAFLVPARSGAGRSARPSLADSWALGYTRVTSTGRIIQQGRPDGETGVWKLVGSAVQVGDLGDQRDFTVTWDTDVTSSWTDVTVGCDLTKSRAAQVNPAPGTIPGLPARTC